MPRPSDQVVTIPPDELRVVLSPSGEMTMWVPIFAEQPDSTIVHADGTVLCRGGPFYHDDLQKAYAAYMARKAKEQARSATSELSKAAVELPASEPSEVAIEQSASELPASEPSAVASSSVASPAVAVESVAQKLGERPTIVRPKVARPVGVTPGASDRAPSR